MKIRWSSFVMFMILLFVPAIIFVISAGIMEKLEYKRKPPKIEGIFWQVDQLSKASGNWQLLGINTLITQWSVVDNRSFLKDVLVTKQWDVQPDWQKITAQPWSKNIILGLASIFQEPIARENINQLYEQSQHIIHAQLPLQASGYYFPIEADPTWHGVHLLGQYIAKFNCPIWISIYSAEPKAPLFEYWLESWLPPNAKVFFQDGVGVGTRTPEEAAQIYKTLKNKFGEDRIVIVLEAFRHKKDGTFRAAYPWEIAKQLKAYSGQSVYIFDGPHYLNRMSVLWLYLWMKINY